MNYLDRERLEEYRCDLNLAKAKENKSGIIKIREYTLFFYKNHIFQAQVERS